MTTTMPQNRVQSLDNLVNQINDLHIGKGLKWREIGKIFNLPAGTLASIAKGREPKDPHTRVLLRLEKPRKPSPPAWATQGADFLEMKRKQKLEEANESM
jgi:hypothetical protein